MRHIRGLFFCALTLVAAACSSGSEEGSSDDLLNAFTFSGSVGDGPIVGAEITVIDAEGNLVTSTTSDDGANYSVEIPGQTPLPVTVRVQGGTDLVTQRASDFELVAALHTVGTQTVNVSPLTTLAVRAAECSGDVSPENLDLAWQAMSADLNMGLDSAALADPMASAIDESNIETAVLANEAVGEWVRRTGAALQSAGFAASLDEVVEILACDMADGAMDGAMVSPVGGDDDRVLAVAQAAEIAVRLEVLAGRLEVDGVDATSAMNAAIRSIMPTVTDADVNTVPLGMEGVSQLVDALAVMQGVYADDELVDFMLLLDSADADNVRALVDAALSAGPQNTLQGLAERVSLADATAIADINARQQEQDDALAPIVSLSADPVAVDPGTSTTLSWATSNADQCSASGAWDGEQQAEGTFTTEPLNNSTSFSLACTGVGGVTNATVAVTVGGQPQPDAPTVSLSASASQIDAGDTVTLSWSSTDATACTASGGWSGARATSGQVQVGPLQATTSFSLSCSGDGGSASDAVSVTVVTSTPAPTVALTASASQVSAGDSVTLSWTSSNANSCTAAGAWSGARSTTGSVSVGPLQANSTFVLNCSGAGGSASDTVSIRVNAVPVDPPSVNLSASATQVGEGDSVTLSWSSSNATSCAASGAWNGARGTSGSMTVGPLQNSSTFVLNCSGDGGSASDSVSITVTSDPPPSVSLTANATQVNAGDSVSLSWSSTNANSCSASGNWSGARSANGQQSVGPLQTDSTFVITCSGDGGTASDTVNVSVTAATPPSLTFSANTTQISAGQNVTLTWNASDADSCSASGGWNGARATGGQEVISNLQSTTTFTLSCSGDGGSVVEMVNVSVVGELTMSWQAPDENVDGSSLTPISAYRIYYGTSTRNYDDYVEVSGSATSHTLQLLQGDYFLAITAVNSLAEESGFSNEVRKSAQ